MLAAHRSLGLKDRFPFGSAAYQVVGRQAQPGVAQIGLDGRGTLGRLGLPAQRFELTPELGGQIGEPGQVRRHRVEFAQSFFLALAMLEHTGGFLDERPPILRPRLQDLLELPLPNNHMHLTADAGVAQQLLHIHQTATAAVDFVFAGTVAKHSSGDRHLGVFDRQCVVGVVDANGDFGAAQRRTRRGAGEDDVFHLAAAQRLCPLLPITHARASTTLDLPEPLGPTTAVMPGSKRKVVGAAKDLKPFNVRLLRYTRGQITAR